MTLRYHSSFNSSQLGIAFSLALTALIAHRCLEWNQWRSTALAEEQLTQVLEDRRDFLVQGNAFKHAVLERLSDREITLEDAAETLLAIDSERPFVLAHIRSHFPGGNDLEREARCIIHLTNMKASNPIVQAFLRERLKAEFHSLFPDSEELCFATAGASGLSICHTAVSARQR